MRERKQTNFRLPEITRKQIEEIRQKSGYATATDVVVVAVDRMAQGIDSWKAGLGSALNAAIQEVEVLERHGLSDHATGARGCCEAIKKLLKEEP